MGRKKRTKLNPDEAPEPVAVIAPDPPNFAPPPMMPPPSMPPPPAMAPLIPPPADADPRIKQESSSIHIKSASIKKVPDVGELGEL